MQVDFVTGATKYAEYVEAGAIGGIAFVEATGEREQSLMAFMVVHGASVTSGPIPRWLATNGLGRLAERAKG